MLKSAVYVAAQVSPDIRREIKRRAAISRQNKADQPHKPLFTRKKNQYADGTWLQKQRERVEAIESKKAQQKQG